MFNLFSNHNFSRTDICIWIRWVVFKKELKCLHFLKKKKLSSYRGSFVINKNVNIGKWKEWVLYVQRLREYNGLNRFKISSNALSNVECLTESNAFLKSNKSKMVTTSLSIPRRISSLIWSKVVCVLKCLGNPDCSGDSKLFVSR